MYKKNVYGKSRKGNKKSSKKHNNTAATKKTFGIGNPEKVRFRIDDASKQTPPAGSPYSLPGAKVSPFFPLPTPGSPECIFIKFSEFLRAAQEAEKGGRSDGDEIMPGVKAPFPGGLDQVTRFEDKMKLLDAWDKQCFAKILWLHQSKLSLTEHFGVKDTTKLLNETMNDFKALAERLCREAMAEGATDAPTEQELVEAYERSQYERRKALGEPVLFQDGHLRFERILADNGILPGPFPGLDLYSQFGQTLAPETLIKFLHDMKPQREAQKDEGVGFFGCPGCPLWAADMLRYCAYAYGVCGSESYRAYMTGNGQPAYNLVVASLHARVALESGKPLPCMAQD